MPSKLDAFYAKAARGHGVPTEYELIISYLTFNIIYFGGIRFSSRWWIKACVFENVTAILFLVSSIAFDKLTNGTWNCLADSCDFFNKIINSRFFAYSSFILFFTKADLLEEKIKHSNIKEYFPEFQGDPRKLEDVQSFIFQMFDDKRQEKSKVPYHFFTAAGNTEDIRYVFAAVKDIILENNLKSVKNLY